VVGYPTLTAFSGFTTVLVRRLGQALGVALLPRGFAIVHHTGRLRAHGKWHDRLTQKRYVHDSWPPPSTERRDYYFSPSGQPMPEIDLSLSLLVNLESSAPLEQLLQRFPRDDAAAVIGPRALGGTIQSHGALATTADFPAALRAAPTGHVLVDRSAELLDEARDPLDLLLDKLERPARRRLAPMQIGWRGLTPIMERETPRGCADHAFVEPLIGLVEFLPRYRLETDTHSGIWRPRIDRTANMFLLEDETCGPEQAT
jgi:hypothetical protein